MTTQGSLFSVRLIELATYIARRYEGDMRFGLLKLAKVIFFCDQEYFRRHGETFTDYQFYAWKNGPFNASLYMLDEAEHLNWIPGSSEQQRILVSERDFDDQVVPEEVQGIADHFIETFRSLSYQELSEVSHGMAWQTARGEITSNKGPEIPVSLYYLGEPEDLPLDLEAEFNELMANTLGEPVNYSA